MTPDDDGFGGNVFINCPFDPEYLPLAQCLVFAVLECGFKPRIASERADSGQVRIEKIRELIRACRFSIHDISRMEPLRPGDLPRFNMPFELGLDLGCWSYGPETLVTKQCLVLERDRHRYQTVLSDLSGHEVRAHGGDPESLVLEVRNWLRVAVQKRLPSGSQVWQRFNLFRNDLELTLRRLGYSRRDVESLEMAEYIQFVRDWQEATEENTPGAN
jgi:hypothetical protein